MSRSYKKTPWAGDTKGSIKKRAAWKTVRQWLKDNPDMSFKGNQYKKIYNSYDICDYGWFCSWEKFWANEVKYCKNPNKKDCYRKWLKSFKTK